MTEGIIKQIGGTHYEADVQHWDVMELHDVAYLEAAATKYLVRWDKKGTALLDLGKAKSYLERVLKAGRGTRRSVPAADLDRFLAANDCDLWKRYVINLILAPGLGLATDYTGAIAAISTKMSLL